MERSGTAPPDDLPVVLAAEGPHGPIIHAANRAARLAGAVVGARIVDVRAVSPDLRVEYADVMGDRAALHRLTLWARRWCPWTVTDGLDGLILETTGSDHLWGGEASMLVEMETRLSSLGLSAKLAVAPTWGAAWALARYGPVRAICTKKTRDTHLHPLPVDALRLEAETVLLLGRLGLKTIGQISEVPRLSLTRRFARSALSRNPLMRLDQMMGQLAEPVASVEVSPPIIAQVRLPEPIQDPTAHLPGLCEDICKQLDHKGVGCRCLSLVVYRTDGSVSRLEVATAAPSREPAHLCRLFDDRLERLNPGFGFDLITLEAGMIEEVQTPQHRLDGPSEVDVPLSHLLDRLTARLGAQAVRMPMLRESHVPERAAQWVPAMTGEEIAPVTPPQVRPVRLLYPPEEIRVLYVVPEGPPEQFIWRKQTHRVICYAGPERIAPEWWHDRPGTRLRDYFRIEDQSGQRLWLYREGLHEDGRGGDPRWFIHGMFS